MSLARGVEVNDTRARRFPPLFCSAAGEFAGSVRTARVDSLDIPSEIPNIKE